MLERRIIIVVIIIRLPNISIPVQLGRSPTAEEGVAGMRPTASTDAVGGSCVQLGTSSEDEVAHGPNNRAASSASIQKMDAVAEDSDEAQQTHISDVSIASTGIVPPVAHPGIAFPPRTPLAWRPVGIICHPSEPQNSQGSEVKLGGTVQMWVAPRECG